MKRDARRRAGSQGKKKPKKTPEDIEKAKKDAGDAISSMFEPTALGAPTFRDESVPADENPNPRADKRWPVLVEKFNAIGEAMGERPEDIGDFTDAIVDFVFDEMDLTDQQVENIEPFVMAYIDDVVAGDIDPWAGQQEETEGEPETEAEPIPEREEIPTSKELRKLIKSAEKRLLGFEEFYKGPMKNQWPVDYAKGAGAIKEAEVILDKMERQEHKGLNNASSGLEDIVKNSADEAYIDDLQGYAASLRTIRLRPIVYATKPGKQPKTTKAQKDSYRKGRGPAARPMLRLTPDQVKRLKIGREIELLKGKIRNEITTMQTAEDERADAFDKRFYGIRMNEESPAVKLTQLQILYEDILARDEVYVEPDPMTPTTPRSANPNQLDSMMPTGQYPYWEAHMDRFIEALDGKTIDEYVQEKLGYKTLEEMWNGPEDRPNGGLAGEQIDAIANMIRQIDVDGAFVLADQTGMGKGRQVAAAIAYATRIGKPVIFMTEKPNLFADMMRDLIDIGFPDVRVGIVNNEELGKDENDRPLKPMAKGAEATDKILEKAAKDWDSVPYDALFVTYTQFHGDDITKKERNGPKRQRMDWGSRRMEHFREIAKTAVVLMDESHEAAGKDSDANRVQKATNQGQDPAAVIQSRAGFLRDIVRKARSIVFSSATWAKTKEALGLYAMRTGLWQAAVGTEDLTSILARGGIAMQQVMSSTLSEDGQYVRHERNFTDAEWDSEFSVNIDEERVNELAQAFNTIRNFDVTHMIPEMERRATLLPKQEGASVKLNHNKFTSIMHNLTDLAFSALTVDAVTNKAIQNHRENGDKIILAFEKTGESMLKEYVEENGLNFGDVFEYNMATVAQSYLSRTLTYSVTVTPMNGKPRTTDYKLTREDLTPPQLEAYEQAEQTLIDVLSEMVANPFDRATTLLKEAGINSGEITSRSMWLEEQEDGRFKLMRRAASESKPKKRREIINRFNGGKASDPLPAEEQIDAITMNKSGATGNSMHASGNFGNQMRRAMFIVQAEKNINTFMQMLGRINRTGQLLTRQVGDLTVRNNPIYYYPNTNVPVEARMKAIISKKLQRLNANVTASASGGVTVDVPDFVNNVGSMVAADILRDEDSWRRKMGISDEQIVERDLAAWTEALVGTITKNAVMLDFNEQERFFDELANRYIAEIQRLKMLGENVGAMEVADVRARGQRRIVMENPVGSSAFQGPIYGNQVSAKLTSDPVDFDSLIADIEGRLDEAGISRDGHFSNDMLKLRHRGAILSSQLQESADIRHDDRVARINDDPELSGSEKQTKIDKMEKARRLLKHGDPKKDHGREGLINKLVPGQWVRVRIDGDWVNGLVSNIRLAENVEPYSLSSWRVDIAMASPHRPWLKGVSMTALQLPVRDAAPSDTKTEVQPLDMTGYYFTSNTVRKHYDDVQTKVKEGREDRVIITGNVARAFARYSDRLGTLTQFTDHLGNRGAGYILHPRYATLEDVEAFHESIETPEQMLEFFTHPEVTNARISFHTAFNLSLQIRRNASGDRVLRVIVQAKQAYKGDKDKPGEAKLRTRFGGIDIARIANGIPTNDEQTRDKMQWDRKRKEAQDEGQPDPGPYQKPEDDLTYNWRRSGSSDYLDMPLTKAHYDRAQKIATQWMKNSNPEHREINANGSAEEAKRIIRKIRNVHFDLKNDAWDPSRSILEGGKEHPPLPLVGERDEPFTYMPMKATSQEVQERAQRTVDYLNKYGSVLASQMTKDFYDHGATPVVGRKVETLDDIAVIGQAWRNPSFESFHAIFVKGNRVVGTTGVSLRLPGMTEIAEEGDDIRDTIKKGMKAYDADGYYVMHNHPSGDPQPSMPDYKATLNIANKIEGFRGHVIINETEYGVVSHLTQAPTEVAKGKYGFKRNLPEEALQLKNRYTFDQPIVPHDFLGVLSAKQRKNIAPTIAEYGAQVQTKQDTFTLIGLGGGKRITGIIEVPIGLLEMGKNGTAFQKMKLGAMLKKVHFAIAANELFAVGVPWDSYRELMETTMKNGLLAGVIDSDSNIATAEFHRPSIIDQLLGPSVIFGREKPRKFDILEGNIYFSWHNRKSLSGSEEVPPTDSNGETGAELSTRQIMSTTIAHDLDHQRRKNAVHRTYDIPTEEQKETDRYVRPEGGSWIDDIALQVANSTPLASNSLKGTLEKGFPVWRKDAQAVGFDSSAGGLADIFRNSNFEGLRGSPTMRTKYIDMMRVLEAINPDEVNKSEVADALERQKRNPEFKALVDRFNTFIEGVVQFAVDTGAVSKEKAEALKSLIVLTPYYSQYLEQNRLPGPQEVRKLLERRSSRDDVLDNIVRNVAAIVQAAEAKTPLADTTPIRATIQSRPANEVRNELKELLAPASSLLKSGRLKVVQSDADLPGHLQVPGKNVRGVVDHQSGVIYMVADNVGNNAKGVFLHEVGVHAGLKRLLGDKFDEVLRQIRGLRAVKNAAVLDAYARVPANTDPARVDEEALAYLVENEAAQDTTLARKVISAVKAWLFRRGINLGTLTPSDMLAVAAAAARSAGKDKNLGTPLTDTGETEDARTGSETPPSYSIMESASDLYERLRGRDGPRSPFHDQNQHLREKDRPLKNKISQALKRYFAPGGLLPEGVFKLKIWRDSKFNVAEMDIRNLIAHLDDAIMQDYGMKPEDLPADVREMHNRALQGERFVSDTTGEEGFDPRIPERTATQLGVMIAEIRRYSEEYGAILFRQIEELKADNRNAEAAAKAALLETINANLGKYVHRSYRVFDDKNWATRVPDDVMDDARWYLKEQAEIQAQKYDEWAAKAEDKGETEKAEKHRQRAEELRDERRADAIMNEILKTGKAFDTFEDFIRESKLGAKDLSILKHRKDIAPQIRALMGEYTDPRLNFAKTVTKLSRLIFNQRFLDKVLEQGLGVFLFRKEDRPVDARVKIAAEGEAYSPLGGYYTFPEVEQAFKDVLGKDELGGWYQTVVQANGWVKYGKTVLSPTTAMRNWMSAFFFATANGHFDMTQMRHSVKSLKEYFTNKGEGLAYLRKLQNLGVVYDTPYAGEMSRLLKESRFEELLVNKKGLSAKRYLDYATRFYQFGDDFWKILGFENEVNLLMKHKDLSRPDAEEQAAERIRNTYPTYSMTGKAMNWLRRFPLAGTFVSFPSEIIRTTWNMLNYLKQDMADPDLRPLAMRRVVGLSISSGLVYALQAAAMSMFGVDDDEEEAFRQLAAPWQRNSNILPISRDAKGNLQFIDMSFLDPYNYWKRPINAILRDQPFEDIFVEVGREVMGPFFGQDIAAGALFEAFLKNERATGGRVYNPQDTVFEQSKDIADHLRKAVQPGIASNVERMSKALSGKTSPSGRVYSVSDEAAAFVGFRVSTHDPRAALYYKSFSFRDMKKDATSIMTAVARDPNKVSDSELKSAYERAMVVRTRAYVEMAKLVSAAKTSGLPDYRVRQVLSQSGISKKDVNALMRGEVPAYRPSRGYLKQAVNKARVLFPEKAAEIERRRTTLRGLGDN